jgi:hypothetical protein
MTEFDHDNPEGPAFQWLDGNVMPICDMASPDDF